MNVQSMFVDAHGEWAALVESDFVPVRRDLLSHSRPRHSLWFRQWNTWAGSRETVQGLSRAEDLGFL